jgi:hypothetical protein
MTVITQTGPYVPRKDQACRSWLNQFARQVGADPQAFDLSETDGELLLNLAAQADAAFNLALTPATRTSGTILAKDQARDRAVATFRVYAMRIKQNPAIDSDTKIHLGTHVDASRTTRVATPVSYPMLIVTGAAPFQHEIRYHDSSIGSRRAKPPGANALELWAQFAGPGIDGDAEASFTMAARRHGQRDATCIAGARFLGTFTKQPFTVSYPNRPDLIGAAAAYYGRWVTRTGLVGPWGPATTMSIPFAGLPGRAATPRAHDAAPDEAGEAAEARLMDVTKAVKAARRSRGSRAVKAAA